MADAWYHLFKVATVEVQRIKEPRLVEETCTKCLGSECELQNIHEHLLGNWIHRIALKDVILCDLCTADIKDRANSRGFSGRHF